MRLIWKGEGRSGHNDAIISDVVEASFVDFIDLPVKCLLKGGSPYYTT